MQVKLTPFPKKLNTNSRLLSGKNKNPLTTKNWFLILGDKRNDDVNMHESTCNTNNKDAINANDELSSKRVNVKPPLISYKWNTSPKRSIKIPS